MKKISASVACILLWLSFSFVNAQPTLDMGKVVLSIHHEKSPNPAIPLGDYVFSMDNGSALGLSQVADRNYTDISFSGDFERDKKTVNLTCSIRISPSGAGTFTIEDGGNMDNEFSINFDNRVVLSCNHGTKGSAGQIIVSHYPKGTGDFLTGTFSVTLNASTNPDAEDLYKATGSFRIKKFE